MRFLLEHEGAQPQTCLRPRQNRIKKLLRKAFTNLKMLEDFEFTTVSLPETTNIADLVNTLLEKHKGGALARYMRELSQCELLILDEVGLSPFIGTAQTCCLT